jgi:hypothetical protein
LDQVFGHDPLVVEGAESPATSTASRAAHWIEFYDRLVEFESEILVSMEGLAKRLSAEEHRAVDLTNLQPMRVLISDFRRRANTWREVT